MKNAYMEYQIKTLCWTLEEAIYLIKGLQPYGNSDPDLDDRIERFIKYAEDKCEYENMKDENLPF